MNRPLPRLPFSSRFLLALALVLPCASCASASATPGAAAPASSPAKAADASGTAPAPTSSAEPTQVAATPAARIAEVQLSRESAMDKRARVVFDNPSRQSCRVTRYVLTWPGGSKQARPDPFPLPAGESRERWLLVHPNDGDLASLTAADAKVTLETDCSAP